MKKSCDDEDDEDPLIYKSSLCPFIELELEKLSPREIKTALGGEDGDTGPSFIRSDSDEDNEPNAESIELVSSQISIKVKTFKLDFKNLSKEFIFLLEQSAKIINNVNKNKDKKYVN